METAVEIKKIFNQYSSEVETEIMGLLDEQPAFLMYDMMRYFFGFLDENLKPSEIYGGKRYRPGLCLMLAQMYDRRKEALEVATAIEIFHNFTLIHDDIEDKDPLRRGRETVWKKWGINHGINTGDGQMVLVNMELSKIITKYPVFAGELVDFLNRRFLEVIEGQFLDFTLSDLSLSDNFVTEENYLTMIKKKTSVLVGAVTKSVGIIAGLSDIEKEALWQFGLNFGLAFQIQDDLISIWAESDKTGKIEKNDLYEKKKTLPILRLYNTLAEPAKSELAKIYNQPERLSDESVEKIIAWLNNDDAYNYTKNKALAYAESAKGAISELSIDTDKKNVLNRVVEMLLSSI